MDPMPASAAQSFDANTKVFVPIVRGASWQPAPEKQGLFSHVAGHGAFGFKPGEEPKLQRLRERLGSLGGLRVLEPGCGSGPLTEWLVRWALPDGRVLSFDPNPEMLQVAGRKLQGLACLHLVQARCEEIVLPENSFDLVLCFRVFPHFDDVDEVLRRFGRWLSPGGRLLIVHWDGRAALNALHAHRGAVEQDVFPQRDFLESALRRHGFSVREWVDNESEIFIEAQREAKDPLSL